MTALFRAPKTVTTKKETKKKSPKRDLAIKHDVPPMAPRPPSSTSSHDPAAAEQEAAGIAQELAPEDFYYEGPYLVFTAAYHLKRGYCCHSGCRHCPYGESD